MRLYVCKEQALHLDLLRHGLLRQLTWDVTLQHQNLMLTSIIVCILLILYLFYYLFIFISPLFYLFIFITPPIIILLIIIRPPIPLLPRYLLLYKGDGASFTGYREAPVNVNGSDIYFRGIMNLDRSLDLLFDKYNLADASLLVLTGGSAGGLSTFLHLDHVQSRMPTTTRVVGEPVCGYFIDHGNDGFEPDYYTYPNFMKYVYNMQNSTGSLSTDCQKSYGPEDAWMCIMAPHAVPFIQTPWFALQSRFDKWQLGNELFLPCMNAQPYGPPFKNSTCTSDQDAAIQRWGEYFMAQLNYTGTYYYI